MVCLPIWYLNTLKKNLKNSCLIGILLPYLGINKQIKVMALLETAKKKLSNRTLEVFMDRKDDLEIVEWPMHFEHMGEMLARIENIKTITGAVEMVETGQFESIGVFPEEIGDFLGALLDSDH